MGFNTIRLQGRPGDVSTATPDDIISNRVAQNARYYQHKKDRPENTHRLNVADDWLFPPPPDGCAWIKLNVLKKTTVFS
jgi:hypothetical protein